MNGEKPRRGFFARLRQAFVSGLFIILPAIITVWLLGILLRLVEAISTPVFLAALGFLWPQWANDPAITGWIVPAVGLVATMGVILAVGFLATNFVGRRVVDAFDRLMLRVPVVKGIYGAARQMLDAFGGKTSTFRRVVAVEYPRPGVYTVGFLTQSNSDVARAGGAPPLKGMSLVFLPTTPNPTSGWLAVVPDAQVLDLDMSIEEGVKLIVSGGLVAPPPRPPEP
ncbi:MAG TPA: DUF502 domain-containing protein [Candidatus Polarisedimenticolia bacterium]|nr:DUF502 domain-containing protein [Candidatus Polarisedimenticolia bacterium]